MKKWIFEPDYPVVETRSGLLRGYCYGGLFIFKGVPYARARRFRRPEPVKPWQGIRDATSYGYVSPVLHYMKPNGELYGTHRYWVESENCQNLNVWTTTLDPGAKKPVFVWFHGGGFSDGSAIEQLCYNGASLAREADCVVVSVNHRLNIFGYLDLSDFAEEYENTGNLGTDDMIWSLKWIRDNIEGFGGDPENVTIAGESGGGGKVTTLLQSWEADGLFHKAMVMSGVIVYHGAEVIGSARECVEALMAELGIQDVHELERTPRRELIEAYNRISPGLEQAGKNVGRMPTRNAHCECNPLAHGFRKETIGVPMIVGTCFAEFNAFAGRGIVKKRLSAEEGEAIILEKLGQEKGAEVIDLFRKAYPERNPVDILFADWVFRVPTSEYIRLRAKQGGKVYSYVFNLDFDIDGGRAPWHGSELPFLFHNAHLIPVADAAEGADFVQDAVSASLSAFMRTGDPNAGAVNGWEPSTEEEECTLVIGETLRTGINFDAELTEALREVSEQLMNHEILMEFGEEEWE